MHSGVPVYDGGPALNSGQMSKAYFTNIDLTGRCLKLWAQFNKQEVADIENMLKSFRPHIARFPQVHPTQVEKGSAFLAKFPADNEYYRAIVTDTSKLHDNPSTVKVTFIDYGNNDWTLVSDMRFGDEKLMRYRPQASECYVEGILSAGESWSSSALEALNQHVCYEDLSYFLFGTHCGLMSLDIVLDDTNRIRISKWLIANKLAIPADPSTVAMEVQRRQQQQPAVLGDANGTMFSGSVGIGVRRMSNTPTPPPPPPGFVGPAVSVSGLPASVPASAAYGSLPQIPSGYGGMPSQAPPQHPFVMLSAAQHQQQCQAPRQSFSAPPPIPAPPVQYSTPGYSQAPPPLVSQQQQQQPSIMSNYQQQQMMASQAQMPPMQRQQQQHRVDPMMPDMSAYAPQTQQQQQLTHLPASFAPAQSSGTPVLRHHQQLYRRRTLQKRSRYDLIICYIKDPEEFYIRLSESEQELVDLMMQMNDFYQTSASRRRELTSYEIGTPCIVLHKNEDDFSLWYRGAIKQVQQNTVLIRFVDYGNDQVFNKCDVGVIDEQFLKPELYAVQSCFHGMPARGYWNDQDIRVFQNLVLNKQFKGVLIDVDDICLWEIFDSVSKRSVTEILIETLESAKVDAKQRKHENLESSKVDREDVIVKGQQQHLRNVANLEWSQQEGVGKALPQQQRKPENLNEWPKEDVKVQQRKVDISESSKSNKAIVAQEQQQRELSASSNVLGLSPH